VKVASVPEKRVARIIEKPAPKAKHEFVVIKVETAPMCNEYLAYRDHFWLERNRIDSLGHEAAGTVVEVDQSERVKVGDRVVALCGFPCGKCYVCRTGSYGHCPTPIEPLSYTGNTSGECCFAQYTLKQDWMLVPIPSDLTTEEASLICCGLGPTFGAMQLMSVDAEVTVVIAGLGAVGLGGVINGVARGARVICIARNEYRASLARSLGASEVLSPTDPKSRSLIAEMTEGRGADCSIDTTGQPLYERFILDATRHKGQVTFLSEGQDLNINVERDLVLKGLTVRGHLDININDAPKLFDVIRRSRHLIDRYVTHRYSIDHIGEAWELQCAGNCGKIFISP